MFLSRLNEINGGCEKDSTSIGFISFIDHSTQHVCSISGRPFCGIVLSAGHSSYFPSKHFTQGPVRLISGGERLLD